MALFTGGGAASSGAAGAGSTQLVYRYTVTGADKATIDTGVDTPDAGTNVWSNGDLLQILFYSRIDEAVTQGSVNLTVNNDTGANYDRENLTGSNVTASASNQRGTAQWILVTVGASATASNFSMSRVEIPNFAGTVGFKTGTLLDAIAETTAGTCRTDVQALTWRSAAAITRIALTPNTAAKKFLVGSQLLVYKLLAS